MGLLIGVGGGSGTSGTTPADVIYDGGAAATVYLETQTIDAGNAE